MVRLTIEEYKAETDSDLNETMEELSLLLAEEEPDRMDDFRSFWRDWFGEQIAGSKVTVIARTTDENDLNCQGYIVGVVRFWQSPYCEGKWLIEGLQVSASRRGSGIGRSLIRCGIEILEKKQVAEVYVHIARNNEASCSLHQSIGFVKVASGVNNSWGSYRPNIDEYCIKLQEVNRI